MSAVSPRNDTTSADEEDLARSVLTIARELAAELHGDAPGLAALDADASIERDIGLDSLGRVELALRVEHALNTTIPETALAEAETPRDLARALVHVCGSVPHAATPPQRVVTEPPAAAAPASPATLLDALEWHFAEHPERAHILWADREDQSQSLSFGSLRSQAVAVAAGLTRRGVKPGDAVAIMLPTGAEFFAAFYGALYAQAIPVPLYPPARPSQIETHVHRVTGILANCGARVLLTFDRARTLGHLMGSLGTRLETVAVIAETVEPRAIWPVPSIKPGDIAFLQYTSGSTGQPKGVMLTHENLLSNLHAMQRATGVSNADRFVSWLPLYHDMGLIGACFGALVCGFSLILMSPFTFLSRPERWLRMIDRHRATITAAPNFAYELCLNKIGDAALEDLNLSSLRLAFNGAEAVSARTVERFAQRFARCGLRREVLMPVYGLAECALGLTFPPTDRGPLIDRIARDPFLRKGVARVAPQSHSTALSVVSCGAALPGHSIRIVDRYGAAVPERTQGRIEFQGPSATSGYFLNPQETARLFDGKWLDTGDLGYLASGELYVTGRTKDVIIRGGHNIHPQELEEAVGQLPGVRKGGVAVFAAADPRHQTERIVVLAETAEQRPEMRKTLVSSIKRLAIDLIGLPVDEVVLAPPRAVLKTSSGKIRRSASRDAYARGELGVTGRPPWLQMARLAYGALVTRSSRAARSFMNAVWGVRAVVVIACLAPPLWLAIVLMPQLTRRRRVAAAFVQIARQLCGVSLRIRRSQDVAHRPQVFVANHASYLDALVLMAALPPEVSFVAKRELEGTIAVGRLLERLGCVFVERFDVHEAASSAGELGARLDANESLVMFPEGRFQRDPGLLPFHMGAFTAAAAANAVVVPIAIRGTRLMLPAGAMLPRPTVIEVIAGEPLSPEDGSWHAAVELRRAAREHILGHIHEPDLEHDPTSHT